MARYFASRILYALLTFIGITVAVFVLIHMVPGDPVRYYLAESGIGGPNVPDEIIETIRREHHLDLPLPAQYLIWLRDVVRLDFGESFSTGLPVRVLIWRKLPRTFELNLIAMVLAMLIAIPLGAKAGATPDSRIDRGSAITSFVLFSLPNFWVALLLIEVLAVKLQWLPLYGMRSGGADAMSMIERSADHLEHLVLPVTTLAYAQIALFTRFTRSAVRDVIRKDYIMAARARGSGDGALVWRHALRSSLGPVITLIGLMIPYLLSGSVIVERIFQWDGVGKLYFDAILSRDYPVVMALTVVTAVITLLASVLTDVLYAVFDPRIRFGRES